VFGSFEKLRREFHQTFSRRPQIWMRFELGSAPLL